jgi:hypothetical protein
VSAAQIRDEARTSRNRARARRTPGSALGTDDIAQMTKLAGEELRRLGYAS